MTYIFTFRCPNFFLQGSSPKSFRFELNVDFFIFIEKKKKKNAQITHFQDTLCLCFKTSLHAKPFIWKRVWFEWKWTCRENAFSYEWFCMKTCFNTESEIAYWPPLNNNICTSLLEVVEGLWSGSRNTWRPFLFQRHLPPWKTQEEDTGAMATVSESTTYSETLLLWSTRGLYQKSRIQKLTQNSRQLQIEKKKCFGRTFFF